MCDALLAQIDFLRQELKQSRTDNDKLYLRLESREDHLFEQINSMIDLMCRQKDPSTSRLEGLTSNNSPIFQTRSWGSIKKELEKQAKIKTPPVDPQIEALEKEVLPSKLSDAEIFADN